MVVGGEAEEEGKVVDRPEAQVLLEVLQARAHLAVVHLREMQGKYPNPLLMSFLIIPIDTPLQPHQHMVEGNITEVVQQLHIDQEEDLQLGASRHMRCLEQVY